MGKNSELYFEEKDARENPDKYVQIEGHTMTPMNWKAVAVFFKTGTYAEAARQTGIHYNTIIKWRTQPWFKKLHKEFLEAKQEEFVTTMSAHVEQIMKGYLDVMTGVDKEDRTANARIQGAKLFAEIGDNPLIKKQSWQVQHNTQINNFAINFNKLSEMSPEVVLEIARTGVVPDELKQVRQLQNGTDKPDGRDD